MATKWRKSPETLVATFGEVVPDDPRVERRQMFGYPCAFVNGNMFMGLHQENLLVRLPDAERAALLDEGGAVFEPLPGRPMREYVTLPAGLLAVPAAIRPWAERALDYAAALPPKAAKGAAKARKSAK